jgi:hypothetical protein
MKNSLYRVADERRFVRSSVSSTTPFTGGASLDS